MNNNIYKIFEKNGLTVPKNDSNGVCYYNTDNKDNKDNKDNRDNEVTSSSLGLVADAPLEADASLSFEPKEKGELPNSESGSETAPEAMLTPAMVDRCLITFFDNGEKPKGSRKQRYKLNIRIHTVEAPGEHVDFIANLNKDRRVFVRNLPETNRAVTIRFVDELRQHIKQKYNTTPYMGKIHMNHRWDNSGESFNQKEDTCAAVVWWTGSYWRCAVMLWDYFVEAPLLDNELSVEQLKRNVKAVSGVIYGANSVTRETRKRKPTFRELRSKK